MEREDIRREREGGEGGEAASVVLESTLGRDADGDGRTEDMDSASPVTVRHGPARDR